MMRATVTVLFAGIFASFPLLAEVPVFHENRITLDEVVTYSYSDSNAHYFRNVAMEMDLDGRLRITKAEKRPLAQIDEVAVTLFQGPVASLYASGLLSVACVALEEPAVLRKGTVFVVVLAETVQQPGEVCMSLLAVTPFEISIPLPLAGLPAGEYSVRVNNAETSFMLTQDQL